MGTRYAAHTMDDLDWALAHLVNIVEHLPPGAQECVRDALGSLERARTFMSAGDVSVLATMSPQDLGALVRTRRESCEMSQQRLADLAGLSDRTIKNVEQGEKSSSLDTLRRLLSIPELGLQADVSSRSHSGHRALANSWLLPRYDRRTLMAELQTRANENGAALEQTMLYLDDQSAQDYLDLCGSEAFVTRYRTLPMADIAKVINDKLGDGPFDVNALGPGDGRTEVALVAELTHRNNAQIRLHLLDISHPLMVIAYQRAVEQLGERVQVQTLHGDFHHLWRYPVLLPTASNHNLRKRLYLMLGGTMANLDNEVAFVRDHLSLAAEGDLCVLDYQIAYAHPSEPDKIRALDPPLQKGASVHSSWMTGPLRRYCADVVKVETEVVLNTRTLVEGSYELDCFVTVHPSHGSPHRHLTFKNRRYTPSSLQALFEEFGWSVVTDIRYGVNTSVLVMEKQKR